MMKRSDRSPPPPLRTVAPRHLEEEAMLSIEIDDDHAFDEDVQDDSLPRLSYSRASSTASGSFDSGASSSPGPLPSFTQRLRQRVSNVLHVGEQDACGGSRTPSSSRHSGFNNSEHPRLVSQFLMGPHTFEQTLPLPLGPLPVRKGSDYERLYNKEAADLAALSPSDAPIKLGSLGTVRTREQIVIHFLIELAMLRRELPIIIFGFFFQWLHSVATNVAYYFQTKLTAAQRVPLQDALFDNLPPLTGDWWIASEYIVFTMIAVVAILNPLILVIRWNPPHRRPLYAISIVRRMFLTLCASVALRIVSFMCTTLPGPSRQCLYDVPQDMTRDEMMEGPAPERGNPEGWGPPRSAEDIWFRFDPTTGCGDLMFSSHTIFTVMFVCVVFRYYDWKFLKWSMVALQLCAIPFILAAHKHYTVDVFTALYVTPLIWHFSEVKLPDMDVKSTDMAQHYGVRFYRRLSSGGGYVVNVLGHEFYSHPLDLPVDLQEQLQKEDDPPGPPIKVLTTESKKSMPLSSNEVEPMIV